MRTAQRRILPANALTIEKRLYGGLVLAALVLFCAACGSGSAPEPARGADSIELQIYPETFVAGGSADSIRLRETAASRSEGLRLRNFVLEARGARELKALAFRLEFDPQRFSPVSADPVSQPGSADELLSLELGAEPGVFEAAQMLVRPQDKPGRGISGDTVLYRFSFAERAQAAAVRRASAVPQSDDARSSLVFNPVGPQLEWRLFNPGDYSQDGQVLASDLTPIGIHFNEDVPAGTDPDGRDENSVQDVIDGNNDGTVAVADLTAIGLNFQNKILSYNIYRSSDPLDVPSSNDGPNGPGTVTVANVLMSQSSGSAGTERVFFDFGLAGDPEGAIYWVRPNDGVSDGTPSTAVLGANEANEDPLASLEADVLSGLAPLTVNFDASATVDDGPFSELSFSWDFDGDGSFDDASGNTAQIQHTYESAGSFEPLVRVEDSEQGVGTASIEIIVSVPGNLPPVADLVLSAPDNQVPALVSMDAGNSVDPDGSIVEYRFDYDSDGRFERTLPGNVDPILQLNMGVSGLLEVTVQVVDDQGGVDEATASVSIFNGFSPAIVANTGKIQPVDIAAGAFNRSPSSSSRFLAAWMDSGQQLFHAISEDSSANNWRDPVLVTEEGCELEHASLHLGVIGGVPVIAYIDEVTGNRLRYVRAVDADGQIWGSPLIVTSGSRFRSPSLRIVDGFPAIAYFSEAATPTGNATAFFVRARNSNGTGSWDPPVTIDSGLERVENVPTPRIQLLFASGDDEPAILFNSSGLFRERADNKRGSDWDGGVSSCVVEDVLGFSFQFESGDEGVGAVVVRNPDTNVRTVSASHPTNVFGAFSNLFPADDLVDSSTGIGSLIEFRRKGGICTLVYFDAVDKVLKYVESTDDSGEDYNTPMVVDFVDSGIFDMGVLNGKTIIVYFDAAERRIKSSTF
ncbi:hypothetical protein IT575_05620 [bacterium]|nr:hypothetical protein [bacterium]